MQDRPVTKAERTRRQEASDLPKESASLSTEAGTASARRSAAVPRAPAPRGRPARALLLLAGGALVVALLIEWLGWRLVWRLGSPQDLSVEWWIDFTRGVLRNAGTAALVSAAGVLVVGLLPAGRRWLRPRLIPVFAAGMGIFLTLLLGLTLWGSWGVP